MRIRSSLRIWRLLSLAAFVCRIGNVSSSAEVIVSVPDQTLAVLDQGKLIAQYRISTSKFGIGDSSRSYRTPLESFKGTNRGDLREFLIKPPGFGLAAVERDSVELRESDRSNDGSAERRPTKSAGSAGQLRLCPNAFTRHYRLYDRVHIGMDVTDQAKAAERLLGPGECWGA
jgi:hypothetical protein